MAKSNKEKNPRLGKVGGQAVMEGVMMKHGSRIAIAVRKLSGEVVVRTKDYKSLRERFKFFKIPILRGIVNFIEMMKLSMSTMTSSAEMVGFEETEGEPGKVDKWIDKHLGKSIIAIASVIGMVLGVALAIFLFTYLPALTAKLIEKTGVTLGGFKSLVEGGLKIIIFILYLVLVSLIPDIKRVFSYHGAEHKSIFCYEKGLELNVENVKAQTRFHPRCGTSFMFVIIILSVISGSFIKSDVIWLRTVLRLAMLPIVVGVGFEYIMYAGKHSNPVTRILSAPGLWMQRITTKEPDAAMIEVAIISLKSAMPKEFPDFEIPFEPAEETAQEA